MMTVPAVAKALANTRPAESMTAMETKKRSLAVMRDAQSDAFCPPEYDDAVYRSEVLQLEMGQTEELLDHFYHREALDLGIDVSQDSVDDFPGDSSNSASTGTVTSANVRSRTTSRASRSTDITAPSYHTREPSIKDSKSSSPRRKNVPLRRSLSFSEYEKFLAYTQARDLISSPSIPIVTIIPPLLTPPSSTPSLFSVSTKKSYFSIKRGFGRMGVFGRSKTNLIAEEVK
jgi:hypothetical protein